MTVIYVDTSALLKRVVPERESHQVIAELEVRLDRGELLLASSLAWLETWRALRRRADPSDEAQFPRAVSGIAQFPLDDAVVLAARSVGDRALRSLDSIHLASAVMVGAHAMMTFDQRLAQAAQGAGMELLQPG